MLFVAKSTPKLGKVDDKTSVLDETVEEKEHACSLEASVSYLHWNGKKINVVDTPGEGSFLAETEDAAVVRVRMQRGALGTLGLPVNEERAGEWIQVDLLVGNDGLPQAVRLVR